MPKTQSNVRMTSAGDVPALQKVLDETGLFPGEMLPDMIDGFLSGSEHDCIWLTCEVDAKPVGLCYAIPEQLTDGTWNMLALAVLPSVQGTGCGRALVTGIEDAMQSRGVRIVIVDTSGTAEFAATRAFYRGVGYEEEARIRDFWSGGDDKVIFRKALPVGG